MTGGLAAVHDPTAVGPAARTHLLRGEAAVGVMESHGENDAAVGVRVVVRDADGLQLPAPPPLLSLSSSLPHYTNTPRPPRAALQHRAI
eukprot:CAMPEP_0119470900 /NCGR_PEP_ID=MMETSP1344-20130328/3606_1 /TAXON_ID=236787 /ORGANISM="Florenciella parvula, Strain CCMP2471" /LENGTH=88 /DNA_ID=CAMNT_0007503635 /DNA_START=1 /DNA_END=268 /DNA_ORIENTATION=-